MNTHVFSYRARKSGHRLGRVTANVIEVENLSKSYKGRQVLNSLSFQVEKNSCVAVLGPNGAGKTTTVEILEGYRTFDSGRISVLGQAPQNSGTSWRARIGIVLQSTGDLGELRVKEAIDFFSSLYPNPRHAEEVIELVGLTGQRKLPVRVLSGGQRRRVDVALGIVGRPELLFLDEPTTGFDPEARRQFWDLISSLKQLGTTIVLTTHYLEEAEALADKIIVINKGRVITEGPPDELGRGPDEDCLVKWRKDDGEKVEIRTSEPTFLVASAYKESGGELVGLEVYRPSLEDRYLKLISEEDR